MEINKVTGSNIPSTNRTAIPKKQDETKAPKDAFVPSSINMEDLDLTSDELNKLILKQGNKALKDSDFLKDVRKSILASMPEMEELKKAGIGVKDLAKKAVLSSVKDPHITFSLKTDGTIETKPTVTVDGTIFVGTGDGYIMKYLTAYSTTGKLLWRSKDLIEANPTIDSEKNLFFKSNNKTVAYDKNGKLLWQFDWANKAPDFKAYDKELSTSSDISGSSGMPAVDEKRNTVYFGEWYGKFFAVDRKTGAIKWVRYRSDMIGTCDPVLDKDGNVYFHDDAGFVLSLKPNGEKNWEIAIGYPRCYPSNTRLLSKEDSGMKKWMNEVGKKRRDKDILSSNIERKDGDSFAVGTPQILVRNEELVVFGTRDGRLLALNSKNGKFEMFFDAKDSIFTTPVPLKDGKVVFVTSSGYLACVDTTKPKDGKYGKEMTLLWDKKLDESASVHFADKEGNIYVTDKNGLTVFKEDGSISWKAAVSPIKGLTLSPDGTLYASVKDEVVQLKPLVKQIDELKKMSQSTSSILSQAKEDSKIVVGESEVKIGNIVLKRKKM